MEIKKIFFDMDGVLADFSLGVKELCNLPEGYSDDEMWEAIRKVGNFYYKLKPMPGAVEMFKLAIDKYGDNCEILTAVPKPKRHIDDAGDDKKRWVSEYLSPDVKVNIVYWEQKKDFCKGKDYVLVDDLKKNIQFWEENGGTGIVFTSAKEVIDFMNGVSK